MRSNNFHILLALTAGFGLSACGAKGADTGDTGLNFAGDGDDDGYTYEPDGSNDDDTDDNVHNMGPEVSISSPGDGEIFGQGEEITFQATISDDSDPVYMLQLEWLSDVDGSLGDEPADGSSVSLTTDSLSPGRHVISLEAVDTEGEISSSTVMITVDDNTDDDDDDDDDDGDDEDDRDGDGFTTADGDCDDNDWYTYPGADEYCDGADNDCDGEADEDFWGYEESNNVLGSAMNLGEIDIDGISTDATSVEVLDLSLHNADDEDWFRFDADDDLYDDIDLRVTYTGPDDVEVKVQLYKLGWDTTIPWLEVTGTGEMILEDEGSIWTADEDLWAIRVLPATDDAIGCDTTYSLLIQA
jgi:hypothetical protein